MENIIRINNILGCSLDIDTNKYILIDMDNGKQTNIDSLIDIGYIDKNELNTINCLAEVLDIDIDRANNLIMSNDLNGIKEFSYMIESI